MDRDAVVLVQHVVQVAGERDEACLRQRGDVRPRVVDRDDRVVLAVHEENRHVRPALCQSGRDLRPGRRERAHRLGAEPAVPGERVMQQRVQVLRVGAEHLAGVDVDGSVVLGEVVGPGHRTEWRAGEDEGLRDPRRAQR